MRAEELFARTEWMKILVTGAAGFIGFHTSKLLMEKSHEVVGLDNVNDYYDPSLKEARLSLLKQNKLFSFTKTDLVNQEALEAVFKEHKFDRVVNLAAQAGVRYSLKNPKAYIDTNLVGFSNLIELCRRSEVAHLVYASTSSVYGANEKMPFSTHEAVSHPLSLYAATKIANEHIAHSYSYMFKLATTGLRFFTVYGPWGRPDMALFLFTKKILAGEPIDVFNQGDHARDFTYVDDIVEGVVRVTLADPAVANKDWDSLKPDPATSIANYRLYNIGHGKPEPLMKYIELLENYLGKKAEKNFLPMQIGDIAKTSADVSDLERDFGYKPSTTIEEGVKAFVEWYREFYKV